MDIKDLILKAAIDVGAPVVKGVLTGTLGPVGGAVVGQVLDRIAGKAGVPIEALDQLPESDLKDVVLEVEREAPEMIALWEKGIEGQHALLLAETRQGFWSSAWRYGWMYLLGFFWLWKIVIVPVVNRLIAPPQLVVIEASILLTLTGWFISLYMGGHTLKELGKSAMTAVRLNRSEKGR